MVLCQYLLPFFTKLPLIDHLIGLLSGRNIRPVRYAFKMHHHGKRLIDDLIPVPTHLKCKIAVLTIGGNKPLIEAADLLPQFPADANGGPGNIIDFLDIVVLWRVRIAAITIVPRAAIAPEDTTGLLQSPIGIYQLRAGHTNGGILLHQRNQRLQPVFLHLRIVVQEKDILSSRLLRSMIAVQQEAKVFFIMDRV